MLYEFKMRNYATEIAKNICCAKTVDVVHFSSVTRWFNKFCSGRKNLNYVKVMQA